MIGILDYGVGNVSSIHNMLKYIGVDSSITSHPTEILEADKLILPGVGSFDYGMKKLSESGFIDLIRLHAIEKGKPLLGICLGMQMLGRRSEEGVLPGLGLIPFDNVRFQIDTTRYKIPHMGWDIVEMEQADPIVDMLQESQRYYFVHSYHAVCDDPTNILMTCEYGYRFPAAVRSGNIYGFQFHPEKSHRFGMTLLKNFSSI